MHEVTTLLLTHRSERACLMRPLFVCRYVALYLMVWSVLLWGAGYALMAPSPSPSAQAASLGSEQQVWGQPIVLHECRAGAPVARPLNRLVMQSSWNYCNYWNHLVRYGCFVMHRVSAVPSSGSKAVVYINC